MAHFSVVSRLLLLLLVLGLAVFHGPADLAVQAWSLGGGELVLPQPEDGWRWSKAVGDDGLWQRDVGRRGLWEHGAGYHRGPRQAVLAYLQQAGEQEAHRARRQCKASTCAIQRLVDLINRSGLSSTIPRTNVGSAAYGRRQVA